VRYEAEAGQFVEGYLLRPAQPAATRRAGIVALHPTSKESIDEIAGVTGSSERHLGLYLCRKGFVVFCPRCYLLQTPPAYRIDVKQTVDDFRKRHPQTLGMHKMLFDAQRAVDILVSLPDVDPARIGATGHSLGAKETLYLAAFDERIRAAVASEGGIGFNSTNWADPWYLGQGIKSPDFKLNHHQLLALIAPRAFLILGGERGPGAADGDRSWPYVEAALPVYRLYGEPPRLGLLNHHQGHSVPPAALERLTSWLTTYLGN
jgi:dienelactone hydrolase